ncbi:MAG: SDR family NAD(P)-dependent oxidoreductase [Bacteroidales bacterium]
MGKLTGKVVFITGSSKGIGKATAIEFLQSGARVVLNGRDRAVLGKTAEELKVYGGEIMEIPADASDSSAFGRAVDSIIERFGRLDILVLNAGLSSYGTVEKTSDKMLHSVMKVNLFGPFTGARTALPHIRKTGGSIIFISSLAGLHGIPYSPVYSMSKMALTALAQSLKAELTGQRIHIGIIYVGFTKNAPVKTAVAPDGSIHPIQERPGWIQQSPEKVARKIVRTVRYRRFKVVLSTMGIIMAILTRYFPRLTRLIMRGMLKSAKKFTADQDASIRKARDKARAMDHQEN